MFLLFTREEQRYKKCKPNQALLEFFAHAMSKRRARSAKNIPLFAPDWMRKFSLFVEKAEKKNKGASLDETLWSNDVRYMNRRPRRPRSTAFSLIELSVVITVLGVLMSCAFYGIGSIIAMQNGLGASQDLREIALIQKKSILKGLNNPPSLSGYAPSGGYACPWLQAGYLLDPSNNFSFNTNAFSLPIESYTTTTMPPTCNLDGQYHDVRKIPGVARSGDGLYDIGQEN